MAILMENHPKHGHGTVIDMPPARQVGRTARIKALAAKNQQEQAAAPKEGETKRLNEYPWPKHWTRAQKRACVAACKRAKKKGYRPNTLAWDTELAKAGFKPNTETKAQ